MEDVTINEAIRTALIAELEELRGEVLSVTDDLSDTQLWKKPLPQSNSIGHLILHLTGNLNHFVGAQLGQTGYVREREREFTESDPPTRAQLLQGLNGAVAIFRRVVSGLSELQLLAMHPHERFGSVLKCLLHLMAHFAMHRGQMSYIARMVK